jgi:xylulokinase
VVNHRGVLGIDLGTGSVKATVVDLADGRSLGSASASYPTDRPEPGAAEQSPDLWWRATIDAVRRALNDAGHPPIEAIGLTGQMHGTVTLDAGHHPNGPAIIWSDQRSAAMVTNMEAELGPNLLDIAGSRLAPGFQAATLRWLQAHRPDRWATTRLVLLPKDYLRLRLTGEIATDPSDAAGTLLFDIRTRTWSPELMAVAGVTRDHLPAIVRSGDVSGRLSREAALSLGLPPGLPVAGGAGDAPAAALGSGVIAPGQLLITLSSGAQALTPLAAPIVDAHGRLHTFASPFEPGGAGAPWYGMGATLNAGNAIDWLCSILFDANDAESYNRLFALAAKSPPGAHGLLALPYLAGERTPHFDPSARGAYIGLDARHDRGDLVRALLEGISFALFDAWDVLQTVTSASPNRIVLAGGGSRSPFWRQLLADLFGIPVRAVKGGDQSALGAAMLGSAAIGADSSDLIEGWVRFEPEQTPDLVTHERYRSLLPIFRSAFEATRGIAAEGSGWGKTGTGDFPPSV